MTKRFCDEAVLWQNNIDASIRSSCLSERLICEAPLRRRPAAGKPCEMQHPHLPSGRGRSRASGTGAVPSRSLGPRRPLVLKLSFGTSARYDIDSTDDGVIPELFWLEGIFGTSSSTMHRGDRVDGPVAFYLFIQGLGGGSKLHVNFIANDAYFCWGFDQLLRYGTSMACQFAIKARLLFSPTNFFDRYYPVCAPLIILKAWKRGGN